MEKWLRALEAYLLKKFNQEEVNIVIDYYKEMISERVEHGENIDDVLASYQMKTIRKDMTVDLLSKRNITTPKEFVRSIVQFFVILLTTPLWIPLAIMYFVLFLLLGIFAIVAGIIFVAGIISIIFYTIEAFGQNYNTMETLGYVGLVLISISILSLVSIGIYRLCDRSAKSLYCIFMKLVRKDRGVK